MTQTPENTGENGAAWDLDYLQRRSPLKLRVRNNAMKEQKYVYYEGERGELLRGQASPDDGDLDGWHDVYVDGEWKPNYEYDGDFYELMTIDEEEAMKLKDENDEKRRRQAG